MFLQPTFKGAWRSFAYFVQLGVTHTTRTTTSRVTVLSTSTAQGSLKPLQFSRCVCDRGVGLSPRSRCAGQERRAA